MRNRVLLFLATFALLFSIQSIATAQNKKPFVIPELREWSGATGVFTITGDTKIVYPKNQTELAAGDVIDADALIGFGQDDIDSGTDVERRGVELNLQEGHTIHLGSIWMGMV